MNRSLPPTKFCHHFGRGNCRFGARCKFSHDLAKSGQAANQYAGPSTETHPQRSNLSGKEEDDLREWKRLQRQGRRSPSRAVCDRFFELAVKLIDGDPGGLQETVRLLADEDGVAYIRLLAEHHIPNAIGDHAKQGIWVKQIYPLFTIITHQRVADSALLEVPVATIYSIIQGVRSQRMKIIFDCAVDVARSSPPTSQSIAPYHTASKPIIVQTCLAVLSKMIDCTTGNIVDETFKAIVHEINSILKQLDSEADEYLMLQSRKWIAYINRRVAVGEELPLISGTRTTQVLGSRAEFTVPKNLPGRLSESGCRHDNDHEDIAKISILPTSDEVASSRGEYLPSSDPTSFHRPGIVGRLDREFRLLREDTVGQLRDVVRDQLEEIQGRKEHQSRERQSLRTYTYTDARVVRIDFERNNGFNLVIGFPQPMNKATKKKRQDWWAQSKRLQQGALVCIVSCDGSALFGVVAEAATAAGEKARSQHTDTDEPTNQNELSLAEDDTYAYIHLNIAEFKDNHFRQALQWYQNIGKDHQRRLVEFPGVLLASFQHTLEALQRMSKTPDIPFTNLIAPEVRREGIMEIPPPQYATKPGFYFDLACLTKNRTQIRLVPSRRLDPQILTKHSTLDETQSLALLNSLCRSLALIQGPPGTGKSYTGEKIIQVLLANKAKGQLGPILCVCYTNHALDQLLEHLLDDGVKQIIRIGSRSKSERLEKVNLRHVARTADRTKSEKASLWDTGEKLAVHESTVSRSLNQLKNCLGRPALQAYLAEHNLMHYQALFGKLVDKDGFQEVRHHTHQLVDQWLRAGKNAETTWVSRPIEQLLTADLWAMSRGERHLLHHHWQRQIRDPIIRDLVYDHRDYIKTREQRNRVFQEVNLRCLSAAEIVGVTTTGLAKNLDLLRKLRCEEAGEVLEAHNLTALLPSIEHCILIGDQLQLRPQIQNYDLSSTNPRGEQYSFDISLFERLTDPSRNGEQEFPFDRLETQRRMHPFISELIRHTLYPSLVDGGAVSEYPDVQGVRKRLFWLHHTMLEDRAQQQDPMTTSHTNLFEVDMTVALVQHLVRQGTYGPDDIAVITPYLGQLYRLRQVMQSLFQISVGERDLEELEVLQADKAAGQDESATRASNAAARTTLLKSIRLATVDNFQGEEAKVVVISLVRSNNERRCGFLSTSNRINVLLSRAKHGMYLLGNADTYGHVPMWAKVIALLRDGDNIGPILHLRCPRHPDHPIEVSTPDHFQQFSPEGGCNRRCDQRLSCGHACINRCHSQVLHKAVRCLEPCPRTKKGCSHACRLPCGDSCEPRCSERLENLNLILSCGHLRTTALCWQAQDPSSIICNEETSKTVPGCNHTVIVPCHVDIAAANYRCTALCGDPQSCGHSCRSKCHRCKDRKDGAIVSEHHEVCRQPCNRNYTTCRHACLEACHGQDKCPPCASPCESRCSHSKCSKKCHEPCAPCAEQNCSSACPHQKCTMPCAAPCNWVPCSRRCDKFLTCGHQCPSLCGEACPDTAYCQICCNENIRSTTVDWIMGMQYHEVNLDEDPCIFPDCGHFLTKTNMDGLMDLKAHYRMSDEDSPSPIALASGSLPFSMDEVKTCPSCRGSLRNIARYGRIIRRATLDEATKKFIAWSHGEYLKLAGQLITIQIGLTKAEAPARQQKITSQSSLSAARGRLQQLRLARDWMGDSRYNGALQLWDRISTFIGQVRKEEQPLQRVADFVRHASRLQQDTKDFAFDESALQVKGVLQASALSLKCEIVIFTDFMTIRKPLMSMRPEIKLNFTNQMQACESLIEMAKSARYPREQVEGHIYFVQFSAFARGLAPESSEDSTPDDASSEKLAKLTEKATAHVAAAREILSQYASTRILEAEVDAAEEMLRGAVFYTNVSAEEMRAVYQAMTREFLGTGHWYTCANGHPFTVGECGMPMEQARCPECGAPVGGAHHQAAEGVRRADEIEDLARGVDRLGI